MEIKDTIKEYISFIEEVHQKINKYVPNNHIQEVFKEVLSAIEIEEQSSGVCHANNIHVKEHAEKLFISISDLPFDKKLDNVILVYHTIRRRAHPLTDSMSKMLLGRYF